MTATRRAERVVAALALVALWHASHSRALADCECDPRPLDAVFVIDSTGSMSGALESVKRRVQRVLELLRENAPSVRVGIVTYRDVGDEYLRRGIELTDNFPKVMEYLKGISANGGGDTPEAIEAGLEMTYSQESMHWDERAKKVAVLIADAPCHDDKKQICLDFATKGRAKGIVLFTISVDGNVAGFKELAAAGGGKNVTSRAPTTSRAWCSRSLSTATPTSSRGRSARAPARARALTLTPVAFARPSPRAPPSSSTSSSTTATGTRLTTRRGSCARSASGRASTPPPSAGRSSLSTRRSTANRSST